MYSSIAITYCFERGAKLSSPDLNDSMSFALSIHATSVTSSVPNDKFSSELSFKCRKYTCSYALHPPSGACSAGMMKACCSPLLKMFASLSSIEFKSMPSSSNTSAYAASSGDLPASMCPALEMSHLPTSDDCSYEMDVQQIDVKWVHAFTYLEKYLCSHSSSAGAPKMEI